ncbi:MAG: hypothetical protein WBD22_01445 [Pyrinomonadaceae bacterium]
MGSTKHEKSFVDFEKAYEQNIVGLKGIIYFGIGLLVLIVVTFFLMVVLLGVMGDQAAESAAPENPMTMNDRERLPPEPRLQSAPGFGVDSEAGRTHMELAQPQAEFRELRRQWDDQIKNGEKDPITGTVVSMPVEEAKERLLQQTIKTKTGAMDARSIIKVVSDSSAGRLSSERGN